MLSDYGLPALDLIQARLEWSIIQRSNIRDEKYNDIKPSKILWTAPEVVLKTNTECPKNIQDIWSLGCLAIEILKGCPPMVSIEKQQEQYWLKYFDMWVSMFDSEEPSDHIESFLGTDVLANRNMDQDVVEFIRRCCTV